MSDRYGVMGHPVAHSKSPFIHARFAAQTAQDLVYEAIHVEPGGFSEAVKAFRAGGGRGLNVTLPFKQEAFALSRTVSPRASRAGAVNTLTFDGESVQGDNTDGVGLVRDLISNLGLEIRSRRVLLLGAGGAARGVLGPLLDEQPSELVIANRTVSRAESLCRAFGDQGPVRGVGFDALQDDAFDLVINATSAEVSGELPPVAKSALAAGAVVYDMMYGAAPTAFLRWGLSAGARLVSDGLGMLVEQAAESFFIWRGTRPETGPVLEALRQSLQ
jgi:shikimate dehydrogenase